MYRSRPLFTLIAIVAAAGISLSAPAAQPKKGASSIKCWTNKDGVRECGENVPPEYAQQGHEVRSESGMKLEETGRVKTDEELAQEAQKKQEEDAKKKAEQEAARQDQVLLATFTSIEDIERVRDDKVDALEVAITSTKTRNAKIEEDLQKRIAAAAAEERAGKSPNEALLKDIESLRRQIANNQDFMDQKHNEQEALKQEYEGKIVRFKELQGGSGSQ
ncbi:MAG: hypothetical protein HYY48_05140 [Gammaproteobacteria bacterium]|nr:hypothetical protein [Gammaproteobacteria bacterium]